MKLTRNIALAVFWTVAAVAGSTRATAADLNLDAAESTAIAPAATLAPVAHGSRWLELNTMSTSLRYRTTATTAGVRLFDDGQHRELLDGRFKLDPDAKFTINFHVSSGRYFNWAYADTIGQQFSDNIAFNRSRLSAAQLLPIRMAIKNDPDGLTYSKETISRGGYLYVRQLYATATPIKQVSLEFGSLPIEHGVNTEITSFDDDGYIAGERLRLSDPKHLYFSEISATSAYLGDPFVPNFFARGQRLGNSNYQQYLVKKKFGERLVASADYTHLRGSHTIREAVAYKLPHNRGLDAVRGEFYHRVNDVRLFGALAPAASGFAFSASKNFKPGLGAEIGYASIDDGYAAYSGSSFLLAVKFAWNSDSFMNGRHPYAKVNWKVAPGLSLNGFYTHLVDTPTYAINGQTLTAGFNYDFADLLHRKNVF